MVNVNEVVLYDARSDNLVTIEFEKDNQWKVRTSLFPEGYTSEIDLSHMFVENDEYLPLGIL